MKGTQGVELIDFRSRSFEERTPLVLIASSDEEEQQKLAEATLPENAIFTPWMLRADRGYWYFVAEPHLRYSWGGADSADNSHTASLRRRRERLARMRPQPVRCVYVRSTAARSRRLRSRHTARTAAAARSSGRPSDDDPPAHKPGLIARVLRYLRGVS